MTAALPLVVATEDVRRSRGLPLPVVLSVAAHALLLGAYLQLTQMAKRETQRVISNVDLLIQVRKAPLPQPLAKAPTPPSTWNFLKMALPSVPKVAPMRMEVKAPELKRELKPMAPKLEDQARRQRLQKLEALDLSRERPQMAQIYQKSAETRRTQALAAMPRLEEVGRRRVRNLPQAMALEEKRREAANLQQLQALAPEPSLKSRAPAALEALTEAAPREDRSRSRLSSILPEESRLAMQPQRLAAAEDLSRRMAQVAPSATPRRQAEALAEKKKGVEIEGPLADRKVVAYDLPAFPQWARDQGVLEAAVSIRFYVSPAGEVLPQMRVEHTSGYGRLDRLAMDSLKLWKFAPIASQERQWGIITFRFVLE